jgi:hypothetical protein
MMHRIASNFNISRLIIYHQGIDGLIIQLNYWSHIKRPVQGLLSTSNQILALPHILVSSRLIVGKVWKNILFQIVERRRPGGAKVAEPSPVPCFS